MYRQPIQKRAEITENTFLLALDELLRIQSFEETTIEQIAERAGLTKSAFLRRFGSKENCLYRLFSIYADEASALMAQFVDRLDRFESPGDLFYVMASQFDELLVRHFSSNRGMNELFKRDLESHEITKKIFGECVQMMAAIQAHHKISGATSAGALSAAQMLVSLNFHYVMRAMPGLPATGEDRHKLIAEILVLVIKK